MKSLFSFVLAVLLKLSCVGRCQSFNVTAAFEKCIAESDRSILCSIIPEDQNVELDLDFECISNNIIKIRGNYSILTLRCESKIAITFDYDGIQPTEAFRINFWKNVVPKTNGSQFTYVVDVEISSNSVLRQKYGHLVDGYNQIVNEMEDDRVYSRSGKYIIRGMWNSNITKSIYFFIEENSKVTFLENSQTQFLKLLSSNKLRIPCRPSHFDADVLLFHNNVKLADSAELKSTAFHYSPEIGFTVDLNAWRMNENGSFTCQLKSGSEQEMYIGTQEKNSVPVSYGFENELLLKSKTINSNILIRDIVPPQGVQQWKHSLSCSLGDSLNVEMNDPLEFQVIETDNPAHTRLLREFVIPSFANRSYLLKKGFRQNEESIIENLNTHVIAYCGNNVSYHLSEHGTALHFKKPLLKGYAFDWVNLKRRTAPNELYISIRSLERNSNDGVDVFYAKNNYTFVCESLRFTQAATVIWYTQRINGSLVEEKIVDKMVGSYSSWTMRITNDVSKVICSTSLWYDDNWKFAELKTIVQEGISPQITNIVESQIVRVPMAKHNNQVLDCLSQGKPPPEVYWRKHGMRLKANILKVDNFSIRAIIKLSEISTDNLFGEYECVAFNFKDRTTAKIKVERLQDVQVWNGTTYFLVIGFPLIVFLCTAMAGIVYIRYFRKPSNGLTRQEIQAFRMGTTLTLNDGNGKNEYVTNINKQPYNKNYEVTRKNFVVYLNEVLGTGAYGMVCKGTVNGVEVAVKTLNALAGKQYLKALLSELKVMLYLGRQENVVQLVGAYTELLGKGKIYVFMELCSLGNLESYLRKYQKDLQASNVLAYVNSREAVEMEEKDIIQQLDDWACHIATGLGHLNEKKVIHGDLAARNILLSSTKIAKITDFGLSRRLYDYADYVKKQQEPLPWRWMAIESLQNLTFSVESDIWSFGVLLWEIFSLGEVPYPGMSWNAEFLGNLKKGMRICKPDLASQSLYDTIILECWQIDPKKRPSPEKIVAFFKSRSGLY